MTNVICKLGKIRSEWRDFSTFVAGLESDPQSSSPASDEGGSDACTSMCHQDVLQLQNRKTSTALISCKWKEVYLSFLFFFCGIQHNLLGRQYHMITLHDSATRSDR